MGAQYFFVRSQENSISKDIVLAVTAGQYQNTPFGRLCTNKSGSSMARKNSLVAEEYNERYSKLKAQLRLSDSNHYSEVSKDEIRTSLVDMHINRLNGLRDYESPDN